MSENSVANPTAEPSLPPGFTLPQSDGPNVLDVDVPPPGATDGKLPPIALIAAGLTAFDVIVALAIAALWSFQRDAALAVLPTIAGPLLLFGIAPVIVGGIIQNKARKHGAEMPGAHWGRWAIVAGVLLSTVTLMIPLAAALSSLSGGAI